LSGGAAGPAGACPPTLVAAGEALDTTAAGRGGWAAERGRPVASVVPLPLDGLGNVVGTEGPTEKRTVTPDTGLPKRSVTVAVTQWFAPTVFVASGGVKMSFAGAPATHSLVAWAQCSTPRSSVKQASMLSVPVRPLLV